MSWRQGGCFQVSDRYVLNVGHAGLCHALDIDPSEGIGRLTSNAGEKLAGKTLYLAAGERHKTIALEKVEDALTKQICDNAYMIAKVEAVSKMYALVSILPVIVGECLEDA